MLGTLVDEPFSDPEWIFEKKFDGERCLVFCNGESVKLYSRNKQRLDNEYPEIHEAFNQQECRSFIVDGEIVAGTGKLGSFEQLQNRMNVRMSTAATKRVKVAIHIFDLLYYEGYDLRQLPLLARKKLLKQALSYNKTLRYSSHVIGRGAPYFVTACRQGWEGVMAKRAASRYVSRRSRDWLKFKMVHGQEFVVGGYTVPGGSRVGFGALLIGYYERGKLHYAGKVGTGYTEQLLATLATKLASLQSNKNPFATVPKVANAHWVRPTLVAEIGFTEWTKAGKLRHPRFEGLRDDKSARDVVRERPQKLRKRKS